MKHKNNDTKKKTVLITGATGDLGYEFIKGYSRLGFNILFTSRDKEKSKELIQFAKKNGCKKIHDIHVDLYDNLAVTKIITAIKNLKLYPETLVNNARDKKNLILESGYLLDRSKWINEFTINLIIPYELSIKLALLNKGKLKNIINIASIYGVVAPNPNIYKNSLKESPINYGTVKAALIHITKELAVRLAEKKIRVNSVSFGGVKNKQSKLFQKKYSSLSPQKKMLSKDEVFGVIKFLTSEDSLSINGQNIIVDGGWTIW
tara:strand:+ start:828 stop:1613 length:786 start_codon:yes stop_codon:yes gene_type:complete